MSFSAVSPFRDAVQTSPLNPAEGLHFHLQPIVRSARQDVVGFEALARLGAPNGEIFTPNQFLSQMEAAGLMPQVDREMFRQVCAFLAQSPKESRFFVSVNLSPQSVADARLARDLRAMAAEHRVPHERLKLEILEEPPQSRVGKGVTLAPDSSEQGMVKALRVLGFPVCFDDFWTSATDSRRLGVFAQSLPRSLPSPGFKVDRSLLSQMHEGRAEDLSCALENMNRWGDPYMVVFEGARQRDVKMIQDYCSIRGCDKVDILFQSYEFGKLMEPGRALDLLTGVEGVSPRLACC